MISLDAGGWVAAGVLGATLGVALWWQSGKLDDARSESSLWRQSAESGQSVIADLQAQRDTLNAVLDKRETDLQQIRAGLEKQRAMLAEAMRHDKQTADWGAAPVPDTVFDLMLEAGARAAERYRQTAGAATPDKSNSNAGNKRKNKR